MVLSSKPTITLSSPTYLDDLSGSIKVSISAAKFASLLAANTSGTIVSVSDISNLLVTGDTSNPTLRSGPYSTIANSEFTANYDGTNRLGNTTTAGATQTTPGGENGAIFYNSPDDLSLSVLQACSTDKERSSGLL